MATAVPSGWSHPWRGCGGREGVAQPGPGRDVVEGQRQVGGTGGQHAAVVAELEGLDQAAGAGESPDRLERVEVVLDEVAGEVGGDQHVAALAEVDVHRLVLLRLPADAEHGLGPAVRQDVERSQLLGQQQGRPQRRQQDRGVLAQAAGHVGQDVDAAEGGDGPVDHRRAGALVREVDLDRAGRPSRLGELGGEPFAASSSLSAITTDAPAAASSRDVASPMPPAPRAISATRPASSPGSGVDSLRLGAMPTEPLSRRLRSEHDRWAMVRRAARRSPGVSR
jgi:hypothetical protein